MISILNPSALAVCRGGKEDKMREEEGKARREWPDDLEVVEVEGGSSALFLSWWARPAIPRTTDWVT